MTIQDIALQNNKKAIILEQDSLYELNTSEEILLRGLSKKCVKSPQLNRAWFEADTPFGGGWNPQNNVAKEIGDRFQMDSTTPQKPCTIYSGVTLDRDMVTDYTVYDADSVVSNVIVDDVPSIVKTRLQTKLNSVLAESILIGSQNYSTSASTIPYTSILPVVDSENAIKVNVPNYNPINLINAIENTLLAYPEAVGWKTLLAVGQKTAIELCLLKDSSGAYIYGGLGEVGNTFGVYYSLPFKFMGVPVTGLRTLGDVVVDAIIFDFNEYALATPSNDFGGMFFSKFIPKTNTIVYLYELTLAGALASKKPPLVFYHTI